MSAEACDDFGITKKQQLLLALPRNRKPGLQQDLSHVTSRIKSVIPGAHLVTRPFPGVGSLRGLVAPTGRPVAPLDRSPGCGEGCRWFRTSTNVLRARGAARLQLSGSDQSQTRRSHRPSGIARDLRSGSRAADWCGRSEEPGWLQRRRRIGDSGSGIERLLRRCGRNMICCGTRSRPCLERRQWRRICQQWPR